MLVVGSKQAGQWGILYDDRATGLAAAVGTLGISKETNLGLMAPDTPIALPVVVQGAGARFTMKLEAGQTYDAACSDGSTQVYCFVAAYRPDGSQDFLLSPTATGVWTFHTLGLAPVTSNTSSRRGILFGASRLPSTAYAAIRVRG